MKQGSSKRLVRILLHVLVVLKMGAQTTNYTALYNNGTFTKAVNVTLPVGTITAAADVASGSAAYSIPVSVPPGTNGVVPSIAIAYNSMSGNGILGRGWNISGLSVITRVSQTIYHNGVVKPVDLSSSDRFALDGERLIGKSGTYGATGATYGTEMENFATITSSGLMGAGPQIFTVVTKDGVTMEYGGTTDSRFLNADNTNVLFWRLHKILYTDGNYIEFKYTSIDRDSRIDEISYTGNAAAGLLPYNKLKFTYTIRTDVTTTYEANASIVSKYLLDKITVTAESSAAFKTYTFKYATNNNINSFLKEVVEAGSDGTLLNSTIFKYGYLNSSLQVGLSYAIAGQQVDVFPGDFNADGYSDIMACTRNVVNNIVYHTDFKIYTKDPTATNSNYTLAGTQPLPVNYSIINKTNLSTLYNFLNVDLSGDGADDIIAVRTSTTGSDRRLDWIDWYESQNNAASFVYHNTIPQGTSDNIIPATGNYIFTGDFNGDGKTDLLTLLRSVANSSLYKASKNEGITFYDISISGTSSLSVSDWGTAEKISVLDFNGDGKSDLMVVKGAICEIYTFEGIYAKRIYVKNFPNNYHLLFFGAFNGDGKTDMLVRNSLTDNNAAWYYHISTGTDFIEIPFTFSHTPSINQIYGGDKIFIADYNGDGKMDISHSWNYWISQNSTASKTDIYYSKGDGFFSQQYLYSKSFNVTNDAFSFDTDGDGRTDILNRTFYTDPVDVLYFNKEGKDLLLHKVKNGEDHTIEWTYKRMTEAGTFYSRGALTAQPLNNIQIPLNLVYEFKSQDGIGGNATTQYAYEEAKLHKEGRGFWGMKKVTLNNLTSGMRIVTETEFNTTYYTAAPNKMSTYLISTSALLSQMTLSNQFVEQGAGTKRIWTKSNSSYEVNVFAHRYLSSVNSTYDNYGNITHNVTNNTGEETTTTITNYGTFGTPIPAKPTSVTVSNTRCCGPAAYAVTTLFGYNTLGQLTSRVDFSGQTKNVVTSYGYNNLGNQNATVVTPAGMTARSGSIIYDSKGRYPLSVTNALSQTATATFDPRWGKPLSQTGIDGQTVSYLYDVFGRLTTTTLPTGFSITETYSWDINSTEGTLHLHRTWHPGKPDLIIWYDLLDREKKRQIEGFQNQWITNKTTYDVRGNVVTTTSPYKSGETVLATTNLYDAYNRLYNMSNTLGTTTVAYTYGIDGYLTTTATNPAGQVSSKITDATGKLAVATDYGGTLNYSYNSQGNLTRVDQGSNVLASSEFDTYARQTKLTDINAGITQYDYDALGQMATQISALNQTTTISYDLLGRVTQRVGPEGTTTNEYFSSGSGTTGNISTKTDAGTCNYGIAKINAVTSITNSPLNIPTLTQNITYTPYFQPATISEGINVLNYTYGSNQQRIKGILVQNGSTTNTRYYFGGYERDISGSSSKHIHYIDAGQGLVAIVVRESGTDTYNYVYTDHIGSILTVTNNSGTVVAEQNFDAWGRKRNTTNWTYTAVQSVPSWLYRGFTGHEHLPFFSLINMNGRLYDPLVGRMLSADNNVQMPDFTQNYNRHSYVLNNPLRYNDPDGEFIHIIAGALIGGLINGFIHADEGLSGFAKGFLIGALAGAAIAATGGAAAVYATTGSLVGAFSGAAVATATASIGGGALAAGVGTAIGDPILGLGNQAVFNDPYSLKKYGKDIAVATITGGVIGGVSGYLKNMGNSQGSTNMFTGRQKAPGTSIWNFRNKPNLEEAIVKFEFGPLSGQGDELLGGNNFNLYNLNGENNVLLPNQFNSVESILGNVVFSSTRKGALQGFIQGDGNAIFKAISQGGKQMASGAVKLPDGTEIFNHFSKTTKSFTLDINKSGLIFKIRIQP